MITHPSLRRNIPESIKHRTFRYFHTLVSQHTISKFLAAFLLLIESLQIGYFALHPACCSLWDSQAFRIAQKILGSIAGPFLWNQSPNSALLAILSILLAFKLIVTIIVAYEIGTAKVIIQRQSTNLTELKIKLVQYTATYFRTVLTIPFISLYVHSVWIAANNLTANTSIVMIIFAVFNLVFYVGLIFLFLLFFIDNSPFSKFFLAGPVSVREKFKNIAKFIIGALCGIIGNECTAQTNDDTIHLSVLIITSLIFGYVIYQHYIEANLVHNMVRGIIEHSLITIIILNIMILVQKILVISHPISIFYIVMIIIGCNFLWAKLKNMREEKLIFSVYSGLTTKNDILAYNFLISQAIRDFYLVPINLIKLEGILSDHVLHCKKNDEMCNCKLLKSKIKQFSAPKDIRESRKQAGIWFEFFKMNLQNNADKMNHEPEFHLLLSEIQKNILQNNFLSYANLEKCSLKKQKISIEFLIYHQKLGLEVILDEFDRFKNEKKQVDVNKFIKMTEICEKLQETILKSSLEHLSFWKSLMRGKRQKSVIMKQGNLLLVTVKKCEQIYAQITEQYPSNLQAIVLFSNYSKYILNNHQLIQKNESTFSMLKKKLNRNVNISGEEEKAKYAENSVSGIIIISGQRANVGIIKHCSSKVTRILKYAPYELVGQNINIIMPKFIGNMHNQVLMKYLEQGKSTTDFTQRLVTMLDKNNFMVLAQVMTKPIPSLINGLQLIGVFNKHKQTSVRHLTQSPKYMLYRCDTGNAESMSQNFYSHYGFRIMKVNQFSDVSQEFNFNTMFENSMCSVISNSEDGGVQCDMILQKNPRKTAKVKVYIRLELIYFGTTVRLLSVFSSGDNHFSSMTINNTIALNPASQAVFFEEKSEGSEEKIQKNNDKKNIENASSVLSEEQLKQLQKKVPVKFRIFQVLLFIFVAMAVGVSCYQFKVNLDGIAVVASFLDHSSQISNSLLYLTNIGYFGRMMQLSALNPNLLPSFNQYRSNVTDQTDSLQKSQFWLVNKEISSSTSIGFSFNDNPVIWHLSEQNTFYTKSDTLSLNIFDLVTSSSIFNSAKTSDFLFKTQLTKDPASALNNNYLKNLFKIRYSSLFELIPAKKKYALKLMQAYHSKVSDFEKINQIEIGVACGAGLIFLLIMIKIVYNIIVSIFSITSLFNWLTHSEIEKEVLQCQCFLEHFFINSYEAVLQLNKPTVLRVQSFKDSVNFDIGKNQHLQIVQTNIEGEEKQKNVEYAIEAGLEHNQLNEKKDNQQNFIDKTNTGFDTRNEEQIPLNNYQSETIQEQVQDDDSIDCGNFSIFVPIIIGFLALICYFIAIFLLNSHFLSQAHAEFNNQRMLQNTLEQLDALKYYGLELVVDPAPFSQYPTIALSFANISDSLYELQRNLNQFSDTSQALKNVFLKQLLRNFNLNGCCIDGFNSSVFYSAASYSVQQCIVIDKGILNQGLRVSIVAYIENIKKTTLMADIPTFLSSNQLKKALVFDKYLKNTLFDISSQNKINTMNNSNMYKQMLIGLFALFIMVGLAIGCCINVITDRELKLKILGTYQIVSLIPERVFKKNTNLCEEYRKNVKDLLE